MAISEESPMTVANLITNVVDVLHAYVRDQEQLTSLASAMTTGSTTFTVSNPTFLARGMVEINDEMVYVSRIDPTTSTATIEPWGRGQMSSTVSAHSIGAKVTQSPLFPRQRVATAIYGALREVFPDLFAIGQTFLDINPARTNYVMPNDCYHVFNVEWHLPGPSLMWAPVDRWRQNKTATTVELECLGRVWPGPGRVRVRYMRTPPISIQGTDDLSAYGYDHQIRDVIVLGAAYRVMGWVEASRMQIESVESHSRSQDVPPGASQAVSRYLFQLFQDRLRDEREQQLLRFPLQIHWTR